MDTQTKLILHYEYQTKEVILTRDLEAFKPVFSFSEYNFFGLTFVSTDEEATLELEYMNEEGVVTLSPYDKIILADKKVRDEGYIPGNFKLTVKTKSETIEGFFTVLPQSLKSDSLDRMRELLEEKASGITRNIYSQKLIGQEQEYEVDCLNLLTYLSQSQEELFQALLYIERHPIESIEHEYTHSKVSKKPTARSQRWLVTKGAHAQSQGAQKTFYEPKMVVNLDTPENRCLKHILYDLLNKTTRLNEHYQFELRELNDLIQSLQEDLNRLNQAQPKVRNQHDFKKYRGSLSSEIRIKESELKTYEKKLENHHERFRPVRALNAQLHHLLSETWLQHVTPIFNGLVTQRLLKNRAYSYLYLVYQELNKAPDEGHDKLTFPYHQTSKLFEYYNVLLLVELLEKQGFKWVSGWLKDLSSEHTKPQLCTLNPGEELEFQKAGGYRIRLSYDKFLNSAPEAKKLNKEQMVSVNSSSRRPDVLIELFNESGFLSAMIVEVKYRKWKSLYQELAETDVMNQLVDYRALNYFDPNLRPNLRSNVIDTTIVIYPNHEGSRYFIEEVYGFRFIPISPTGFSTEVEGVNLVEESLNDFLDRYVIK